MKKIHPKVITWEARARAAAVYLMAAMLASCAWAKSGGGIVTALSSCCSAIVPAVAAEATPESTP